MRTRYVLTVLLLIAMGYFVALDFLPALPASPLPIAQHPVTQSPTGLVRTSMRPTTQPSINSAPTVAAEPSIATSSIDARLLVIAASEQDTALRAIQQTLDYLGTPYTLWIATQRPRALTSDQLYRGTHAFYQGVMLTSGSLSGDEDEDTSLESALSHTEWQVLWNYETAFGIRQVTWFTYPTAHYGFRLPTVAVNTTPPAPALTAQLTPAGRAVFPYLTPDYQAIFRNTYVFLALPADSQTTPLLADSHGNALAAIHTTSDGRQNLALTFENSPDLLATLELSYGIVNWITRGLFLGERHVYLDPQVDDIFIPDDIWTSDRPCGASETNTGEIYRMTGDDLQAVVAWQQAKQRSPATAQFGLELVFNGFGTTDVYSRDTLTPVAKRYQDLFKWVNHTLDHPNLNHVTYDVAKTAIEHNNHLASAGYLGLTTYSPLNLVTPEISGLTNPQLLQAAYDTGVRYLVSDDSLPGYDNPSPNAGIYNPYQPAILMIPRHASILPFNASTPAQWVAMYTCAQRADSAASPPGGSGDPDQLTYHHILDRESDDLLAYLLRGDLDPLMFHQANLRAYDGTHSLLGDLLDLTLAKYTRRFRLPILSPTMDELGQRMAQRMQYNAAGVTAAIVPGRSITISAERAAIVPVTGLYSSDAELYGEQYISYITLEAGQTVTIALVAAPR